MLDKLERVQKTHLKNFVYVYQTFRHFASLEKLCKNIPITHVPNQPQLQSRVGAFLFCPYI